MSDNVIYVDFKEKRRLEYSEEIQREIDQINADAEREILKLADIMADNYPVAGIMPLPDDGIDHD